jgi:hypothetical protein
MELKLSKEVKVCCDVIFLFLKEVKYETSAGYQSVAGRAHCVIPQCRWANLMI